MKKQIGFLIYLCTLTLFGQQTGYWQQHVDYKMDIDMNVENYQYHGKQQLVYTNNSPDELNQVFYHLFFNAFQPGSEMDIRLQNIPDPDGRMVNNIGTKTERKFESRIAKLSPDEIGFIKVNSLKQDGVDVKYETIGTILKVTLNKPILPGESTTFDMDFLGQVPLQIRRSGRNSAEGVDLSMSQWYPKMVEYDHEGWNALAYIAREFHGVWGNFEVNITIDKDYIIGGTGKLQNPNEIGYGYETGKVKRPKGDKLTWRFKAENVHDFTWAADTDYVHDIYDAANGVKLHFLYLNKPEQLDNWKKLQPVTAQLLDYYTKHIGPYPYEQYSVIQGGDGGMEYAQCTLITGGRTLSGLIGVTAHELAHTWFQFLLASNESKHEWMDEGFTTYISGLALNEIAGRNQENPTANAYKSYISLAKSGYEEPLTTYADHYDLNQAYSVSAYNKGAVFLAQLGYVIGEDNLAKTIKKFFDDFKFKHPTPNDIMRTAEKVSGLQLDWYLNYFAQTTAQIDYAVTLDSEQQITVKRIGKMPMPIDLKVTYTDGTVENFYIPLRMMLGEKPTEATILNDWPWVQPSYTFKTSKPVQFVLLDPKNRMADVNKLNNTTE
ncbi:M1 family metallopeptidase [Flavobacteriaceae bacterium F08102]|nr:M1 family metallopeptidase [Flavobacteriaceae bacterium F08102]